MNTNDDLKKSVVQTEEYENTNVPFDKRRSLFRVTAVWAGFPLIITSTISGGAIIHGLGFQKGVLALLVGSLLLFVYVGALSAIAGKTGRNFTLQATDTFGQKGFLVSSALLSTLVLGWFAVQASQLATYLSGVYPASEVIISIIAGLVFAGLTMFGIRALEVIGMISAPLFIIYGITAIGFSFTKGNEIFGYAGAGGDSFMSFGVAVTLVFALFADSGTMTADFTRWAKSSKEAIIATSSAFPIGHFFTMLLGGIVAAGAGATGMGSNIFSVVAEKGGVFTLIASVIISINLCSVCSHCLYNSAVGWSSILHKKMRPTTLVLGIIGTIIAALGVWHYFFNWLNILGVIVPPIGAIIIVDQLFIRNTSNNIVSKGARWQPFLAWAIASGCALWSNMYRPELSTVVVGLIVATIVYLIIEKMTVKSSH